MVIYYPYVIKMLKIPTPSSLDAVKNNKVVMILCDGMRADTAFEEFGYVNSLCNNTNIGIKTISVADNPSISRTNYETLHTGVPSTIHGITSNLILGKSKMERNIFRDLKKANKTTAVIGSSWFYDLYGNSDKYFYLTHKEINPENNEDITYGRFFCDDIPDALDDSVEGLAHTFQIADFLIYKYNPDYVLIHVMTPDKAGHENGIGKKYSNEISKIDSVLGATLPRWFEQNYDVIITSDHGMDVNHNHGGSKCDEMLSPFYLLSKKGWNLKIDSNRIHHTDIAPIILDRILPDNDFHQYRAKLFKNSNFKPNYDCIN